MDIPTIMQALIDALKADKTIAQPYRNYAGADAIRLQALIRTGQSITNQVQPAGSITSDQSDPCICPPAGRRVDCPIHGNIK